MSKEIYTGQKMGKLNFFKMHCAGNDYVYLIEQESFSCDLSALSVKLSNRHKGIGADGLVVISKSDMADWKMRIFNADGSEAEMCGNAACCVAFLLYTKSLLNSNCFSLETLAGIKHLRINDDHSVTVDMGRPETISGGKNLNADAIRFEFSSGSRKKDVLAISMGNPHGIVFCDSLKDSCFEQTAPLIQECPEFPNGANVEFVEVMDRNNLKIRILERGSGETLACGTGACASMVASFLADRCDRKVAVHQPGGTSVVEWKEEDAHVYLSGVPEFSFEGFVQI